MKTSGLMIIALFFAAATAQATDNMKAFPEAEAGTVRYVLQLPKQDNESAFKVELIVGKTVQTDKGNRYFFSGRIEEEIIMGWGFPRYNVRQLGLMAGTLMVIDPDSPKVDRFIRLGGDPYIIRYNSRLPIVVYVPEDAEVRYRIWRADVKMKTMKKG
jgi:ecotin